MLFVACISCEKTFDDGLHNLLSFESYCASQKLDMLTHMGDFSMMKIWKLNSLFHFTITCVQI